MAVTESALATADSPASGRHRSALRRATISELWRQQTATAPTALAKVLQSNAVVDAIRKEVRRASGYNPDTVDLIAALRAQVIRSELLLP